MLGDDGYRQGQRPKRPSPHNILIAPLGFIFQDVQFDNAHSGHDDTVHLIMHAIHLTQLIHQPACQLANFYSKGTVQLIARAVDQALLPGICTMFILAPWRSMRPHQL